MSSLTILRRKGYKRKTSSVSWQWGSPAVGGHTLQQGEQNCSLGSNKFYSLAADLGLVTTKQAALDAFLAEPRCESNHCWTLKDNGMPGLEGFKQLTKCMSNCKGCSIRETKNLFCKTCSGGNKTELFCRNSTLHMRELDADEPDQVLFFWKDIASLDGWVGCHPHECLWSTDNWDKQMLRAGWSDANANESSLFLLRRGVVRSMQTLAVQTNAHASCYAVKCNASFFTFLSFLSFFYISVRWPWTLIILCKQIRMIALARTKAQSHRPRFVGQRAKVGLLSRWLHPLEPTCNQQQKSAPHFSF